MSNLILGAMPKQQQRQQLTCATHTYTRTFMTLLLGQLRVLYRLVLTGLTNQRPYKRTAVASYNVSFVNREPYRMYALSA